MDVWSQPQYLRPGLAGRRPVTGRSAVQSTIDALRAPLPAGRRGVAVPGMATGLRGGLGLRDEVSATPTDAELMALVASGDEDAFASVYDRHAPAVYGTVMRYVRDTGTAEDVVQETFLAMWKRSDGYAPDAGSLIGWLLTIARHRAIDRLRAARRRPVLVGLAAAGSTGEENDIERLLALGRPVAFAGGADEPSDFAERGWARAVVRAAMDEMPEPERRALELAYDQELTQAEIAERLGWPLGTVKTRTRRALLRLRAMLESVPDLGPASGSAPATVNGVDSKEGQHGPR